MKELESQLQVLKFLLLELLQLLVLEFGLLAFQQFVLLVLAFRLEEQKLQQALMMFQPEQLPLFLLRLELQLLLFQLTLELVLGQLLLLSFKETAMTIFVQISLKLRLTVSIVTTSTFSTATTCVSALFSIVKFFSFY